MLAALLAVVPPLAFGALWHTWIYRALVLQSLVEALRMRYGPLHYDFRMRYVYRELPKDVVRKLERLAFVKDAKDLAAKHCEAVAWFDEAIRAIDETKVREMVSAATTKRRASETIS